MGIELPFGLPFWPTAIAWLVAGIVAEMAVADGGIRDSPILAMPVIAAGVVFGKMWAIIADAGLIGVFRALWIIFIFSVFIGLIVMALRAHTKFRARGGQAQGNVQTPAVWAAQVTGGPPPACTSKARQTVMYHATPFINDAYDIFRSRRFKVGPSIPLGFYVSPDYYEVASQYAKGTGAVVELHAGSNVLLKEKGQGMGYFYYHTPQASVGQYINLPNGMVPAKVWDCKGKQLMN